jgi:tetratricopeptide (TPR) repeat protein
MGREAIVVAVMLGLSFPATTLGAEAPSVPELYRLSYAAEAGGDPTRALHWMAEAEKQGEAGYVLQLRRGWLLHLARREAESAGAYTQAIETEPGAVEPRLGAMLPLMALRRWKEAERHGQDALGLAPGDFAVLGRLALVQYMAGLFAPAEASYRQALSSHPGSVEMRVGLGWSLLKQGRVAAARAEFEKVLRIAPDSASAREGMAQP